MDVFGAAGNGRGAWGSKRGCGGGAGGGKVESLLHAVYMTQPEFLSGVGYVELQFEGRG